VIAGAVLLAVVAVTPADLAETLPAASYADTVYVYEVFAANPVSVKAVPETVPTCVPFLKTL
jgi:hypothetical protein